jgi:hypothetical protein
VDAADYVAWRKLPSTFEGDPAGYNTWRGNFGSVAPGSGGSGAVPEPSSVCLAWLLGLALVDTVRARRAFS